MTPQQQTILAMLRKGPITYRHAAANGVPVLHARISELRKEGYRVDKLMLSGVLPTGKKIQFAEYSLLESKKNYKRGQRKPEKITAREYTCEVGEDVMHEGKRVLVQEILSEGSEIGMVRSFIKGCSYHQDGKPLRFSNVYPGTDWCRI